MGIAARLDEIGKPAWIGLMILSFVFYWPAGLAILAFLIWSGRMGCWKHGRLNHWHNGGGVERMHDAMSWWSGGGRRPTATGNRAFDEYREETLRHLEEEQRDFVTFLDRLRFAKDKSEFDEFLAERRRRPEGPAPQGQGSAPIGQ
jgi:hypothetical protein